MKHAWIGVVIAAGGVARADSSVNLLTAVPTVIAVSSTVENPAILPAHIADGKLDTAWNSLTGELVGAWVAVRVPADARVDTIKLTVGFTKVDKKWGDLFTMNPRIKKVRVLKGSLIVAEKTLDPALRTLQDIPLANAGVGGEFQIQIQEIVPGTRKDWQEVNISELEVWGTPGKSTPASAAKLAPVVHVGGFEHDDLTQRQCAAALGVKGKVTSFATDDFTGDLSICRFDVTDQHDVEKGFTRDVGTVVVGIVKRGAKPARVAMLAPYPFESVTGEMQMGGAPNKATTISYRVLPLTSTESVLEVTEHVGESGMQYGSESTTVQLFRIGASGASNVLELVSASAGSSDSSSSEHCTLSDPTPTARWPSVLEVSCQVHHESFNDAPADSVRVDRYKWNGTKFVAP